MPKSIGRRIRSFPGKTLPAKLIPPPPPLPEAFLRESASICRGGVDGAAIHPRLLHVCTGFYMLLVGLVKIVIDFVRRGTLQVQMNRLHDMA